MAMGVLVTRLFRHLIKFVAMWDSCSGRPKVSRPREILRMRKIVFFASVRMVCAPI